jgi:hypothetical protein
MNLTGEKFKDIYKAILTLADNVGLTNTLKQVGDGFGNQTPIYVSEDEVAIDSPLGIGTTSINASAILQIDSTTKGFLMPRMRASEAEAISTPVQGLLIYVNDTSDVFTSIGWYGYNGSSWEKLNNL